jgi:hypothetical protein
MFMVVEEIIGLQHNQLPFWNQIPPVLKITRSKMFAACVDDGILMFVITKTAHIHCQIQEAVIFSVALV